LLHKITFGEMRASGVRDVLIYCPDHRCSHRVEANAAVVLMMSGSRTSNLALPAHAAASAAPRCGRSLTRGWVGASTVVGANSSR
jgi:hypothetical protein